MATGLRSWLLALCVTLLHVKRTSSKIVDGTIDIREDWTFLTRFCYKDSVGELKYHFEYPESYATQNIFLYFDTQWPNVYPKPEMTCLDKEDKVYRGNNQVVNLTTSYVWSGCEKKQLLNKTYLECIGDRRFVSSRERWWYIAVSNCKSTKGLLLKYRLEMTNGDTFWRKHFSADERYILPMDIAFFIIFSILWLLGIHIASQLTSRRLFHFSYKLYLCSMTFEVLSLMFYLIYYIEFGKKGIEKYGISVVGRACHYISHVVFLIMLILMAKGWTVTRGRISSSGQIKLSIFGTVYTVCFAVLFFYEAAVFDPGEVLYIYESPAGIGICVLRVIAWLWFCYGTFFTLKHYPNKSNFYYPFWLIYTAWFLAGPIMVVISAYRIPKWERAQIVNGIDWCISILAHAVFLVITRPSAANSNFPFHMRTNQIGIQEAAPSGPTDNGVAYYTPPLPSAPPPYSPQQPGHFTDITSMFMVSGGTNGKLLYPPANSPNGLQNPYPPMNGTQNGGMNGIPMMTISPS
ncbi:Transmembrane protein 145 [Stylophora pistillata]|uniref:Transmembrane protein 145 n=2 Tax=Stylophora pistillata TaxID=50429 RepID=A0A2B4RFH4_STYPI|nr:Transmembrane protein 145 [Stylophora pistillata]